MTQSTQTGSEKDKMLPARWRYRCLNTDNQSREISL